MQRSIPGTISRDPSLADRYLQMKFPETICGHSRASLCDLFKDFLEEESGIKFKNGEFLIPQRQMTAGRISGALRIDEAQAQALLEALTAQGFLEPDRAVPARKGMALAQFKDRPRIPRVEADRILAEMITWAKAVNARPGVAIRIVQLEVYGSYWTSKPDLGDLDVIVVFNLQNLLDAGTFSPEAMGWPPPDGIEVPKWKC